MLKRVYRSISRTSKNPLSGHVLQELPSAAAGTTCEPILFRPPAGLISGAPTGFEFLQTCCVNKCSFTNQNNYFFGKSNRFVLHTYTRIL